MSKTDTSPGTRFLIAFGTRRYKRAPELPSVDDDVRRVVDLFTRDFGYRRVLPRLGAVQTSSTLKARLGEWLADGDRDQSDVAVLYYSGHGIAQAGQHYLLLRGSDEAQVAATGLRTATLAELLADEDVKLRRLLVILDTCYSGKAAADMARAAVRLSDWRPQDSAVELWIVAAARSRDAAEGAAFSLALRTALCKPKAGALQPYIPLDQIVGHINDEFESRSLSQRAVLDASRVPGPAPFFPNPDYVEGLPRGLDLDAQRRWQSEALGVEFGAKKGWYFTGRVAVLRELVGWLTAPRGDGRIRIVTGNPGSGKTAVLSRLATMSIPYYRRSMPLDDADPGTVLPENSVDCVLYARGNTLNQLAAQVSEEANLHVSSLAPSKVVAALARRKRRFVLVLDAPNQAKEPERIVSGLVTPLATAAAAGADLRLLIATRRELLSAMPAEAVIFDLDEAVFSDWKDLAQYVELLLSADEPSPYRDQSPELIRRIAEAVAKRAFPNFLVARIAARNLTAARQPLTEPELAMPDRFPASVGEAFDAYLRRFGADETRVRDLLTPLAYAEGTGFPWAGFWAPVAAASSGRQYSDDDVRWLLANAGTYIIEDLLDDYSVYRLFHQALAEHLRRPDREQEMQRHLTRILVAYVRAMPGAPKPWIQAHPYVRAHLADHAAKAGELDRLAVAPLFRWLKQ